MTREEASDASPPERCRERGEAARGGEGDPASRGGAPTPLGSPGMAGQGGTPRGTPRIVGFLCSWCAYAAADRAGQRRVELPHSLLTVRVMCTGRVEPAFVLQAFREGADGVLVAGCHPGDCHYVDGNLRAAARHAVLARALEQAGIAPARFRLTWAGANDAEKLAAVVREMTEALAALGPLDYASRALGPVVGLDAPAAAGEQRDAAAGGASGELPACAEAVTPDGARVVPACAAGEAPARALAGAPAKGAPPPAALGAESAPLEGPVVTLGASAATALPRGAAAGAQTASLAAPPRAAPGPRAPGRPRVAFYWNASCGGCEEAVIDLEAFAPLLERVEVVLWPLVMDAKRSDVEALPDGGIDLAFVNGAVRLDDQLDWSRLLRRKARALVAFGACAHLGGVVGLGNLSEPEELLAAAYRRPASVANPDAPMPGADGARGLPVLLPRALPLADVVPVDWTVPGCPPSPAVVQAALDALLDGPPPPRGAVLAPNAALCETCPRKGSMPERLEVTALRRIATAPLDPDACFLAQGLVCLGPGARQGCQPGCLEVGMPCRGCFGPLDGVRDAGAAALTAFASLLAGGEREVAALAGAVPDPAGTFWRYSFAAGLVPRRARPAGGEEGGA